MAQKWPKSTAKNDQSGNNEAANLSAGKNGDAVTEMQ